MLKLYKRQQHRLVRGLRERGNLLANPAAARSERSPAADRAEQAARPLVDCLDT